MAKGCRDYQRRMKLRPEEIVTPLPVVREEARLPLWADGLILGVVLLSMLALGWWNGWLS